MSSTAIPTALTPGCDLWFVTDLSLSKWTRKIDWYLNFQIHRAASHQPVRLSAEIQRVIEVTEFELPFAESSSSGEVEDKFQPLLIASDRLLPNKKTVVVPGGRESKQWVQHCHQIWSGLNRPSLRVFLPANLSVEVFLQAWPEADKSAAVELVAESDLINH